MAKATTTAVGSQPATCLLDPACGGTWEPAAVDDGVDESVLFMFDAPVHCKAIEVELAVPVTSSREKYPPIVIPNESGGETVDATTSDGWLWRGACSEGSNVRVELTGSAHVAIRALRLLDDDDKIIRVVVPRLVPAKVSASTSLSPIAYQPAFLFDSRRTFAWAYDGDEAARAHASPFVTIEFAEPLTLAGVRVWNGDQRSSAHYTASGRPSALSIRGGDDEARGVALDGEQRASTVAFPPLTSRRFQIVVDEVSAGATSAHVAVAELRFIDGEGRIVHPIVTAEVPRAEGTIGSMIDVSYVGVVGSVRPPGAPFACIERRVRLSSTSAFHAVTANGPVFFEGAWEPSGVDVLRVHGFVHRFDRDEIAAGEVRATSFAALPVEERSRVVAAVWSMLLHRSSMTNAEVRTRDGVVFARSPDELATALAAMPGAMAVTTPVFTDVMLPAEDLPFFCE